MPDMDMNMANANPDPYLSSAETGYPNVDGSNKGVILEIRRERGVELVEEGLRYPDLLRWKAGKSMEQDICGIYLPGTGEFDIDGDGNIDIVIYAEGQAKPSHPSANILKIGTDIFLTEGTKGYVEPYATISISFDEARDYYLPIPIDDRTLNNNLTQNPGWNDGLTF